MTLITSRLRRILFLTISTFVCGGCATLKYNSTGEAKLKNADKIWLVWLGPDEFIYVPDPVAPFHVITSKGDMIQPKAMKTDGGSIPRVFRASEQYSPWRFTPAFMIHDWLFEMKHCDISGGEKYDVKLAADVMSECVKAQMEADPRIKNVTTLYLMDVAVRNFAGKLWDHGVCDMVETERLEVASSILEIAKRRPSGPSNGAPTIFNNMPRAAPEVVFAEVPARLFRKARSGNKAPSTQPEPDDNVRYIVPVIHVNAGEAL